MPTTSSPTLRPTRSLENSPERVTIWFTEPLEPALSEIKVFDTQGVRVDRRRQRGGLVRPARDVCVCRSACQMARTPWPGRTSPRWTVTAGGARSSSPSASRSPRTPLPCNGRPATAAVPGRTCRPVARAAGSADAGGERSRSTYWSPARRWVGLAMAFSCRTVTGSLARLAADRDRRIPGCVSSAVDRSGVSGVRVLAHRLCFGGPVCGKCCSTPSGDGCGCGASPLVQRQRRQ